MRLGGDGGADAKGPLCNGKGLHEGRGRRGRGCVGVSLIFPFSERGPWSSKVGLTGELVRNADSRVMGGCPEVEEDGRWTVRMW